MYFWRASTTITGLKSDERPVYVSYWTHVYGQKFRKCLPSQVTDVPDWLGRVTMTTPPL